MKETSRPIEIVQKLVLEARDNEQKDRRTETRYPLFRPVSMQINGRKFSAFSREISAGGIGLLHNFEIGPGTVEISILGERGYETPLAIRMIWCRPCGEGWYLSGGQFTGLNA